MSYYSYYSQPTYHQIRIASSGSYNAQWLGLTSLTLTNGQVVHGDNVDVSTWDASIPYQYAWISLNEYMITTKYNMTYDQKTSVVGHEIGHALAAGHDSNSGTIMYGSMVGLTGVLAGFNENQQMRLKYGF